MQTVTLKLKRPHSGQRRVTRERRRFNALACGRRWGKTTALQEWEIGPALEGYPVGWFAPSYKLLLEAWRELSQVLRPVTARTNMQERRIELITGGLVEFWSLDDPDAGRSRKYRRVAVDEAGLVKDLAHIWHAAIRPTLADYQGDAMLAGTPKGRNGFWELWQRGGRDPEWASWQMPTESNPHIRPDEVAAMRASMPALVVAQEIDAEFTDGALNLFRVEDIDRAAQPYAPPTAGPWLTTVDVGRRRDATVINTFSIGELPYRRAHFERLERVPYPYIHSRLAATAAQYPGRVVVESNGIGDPLIETAPIPLEPWLTTARSKLQALQALQLLFERGDIRASWDPRERAALIGASWDDAHTADEVMSLAIFAGVADGGMDKVASLYRRRAEARQGASV